MFNGKLVPLCRFLVTTALAASSLCAAPTRAAVPEAIATGAAVGGVIEDLKNAAKAIIQQLESTVGLNQFQIRQSLLIIQDELAFKLKELEGKTFADLNKTQREFFLQTEAAINEAARASKAPLTQVQGIADTVNTAVARLPLADKSARVLLVSPAYVLQTQLKQKLSLKIVGSELNHGAVSLTLAAKSCELGSHTDGAIEFLCDISAIKETANVAPVIGDLQVDLYRSFIQRLAGAFGGERPKKAYRLMVQLVPATLGSYSVQATFQESTQQREDRTGVVDAGNGHCDGEKRHGPFIFSVTGGPEWTIVSGTIREGGEVSGNQGRSLDGPLNVTNKGFNYFANLNNGGSCVKVGGTVVSKDARAWLKKNIHWTEERTVVASRTSIIGVGTLVWGKDVPLPLPPNTQAFRVTVQQIDGTAPVVINLDNSQKWFRVDSDAMRQTLVLRPRSLEEALR